MAHRALAGLVDRGFGVTVVPELWAERLSERARGAQLRPFALPEPVREVSFLQSRTDLGRGITAGLLASLEATIPEALRRRNARATGAVVPPS